MNSFTLKKTSSFVFSTLMVFFCFFSKTNLAHAIELPRLSGPVVDEVGLLSRSQQTDLAKDLFQLNTQGLAQIQVLIVPHLQGLTVEQFAIATFDQWKLGDEKKDNGVLLLISTQERKVRIEVGQGLEGPIPDVTAKRIIRELFAPLFKQKQYYLGIKISILALQEAINLDSHGEVFNIDRFKDKVSQGGEQLLSPDEMVYVQQAYQGSGEATQGHLSLGIVALILFGLWLVIFFFSPSTALWILYTLLSGGRGGGGGGGGSWSGGGGKSSGGGASGDW